MLLVFLIALHLNWQREKNQSGVRYHDTYVKINGKWLIKKRESDFMFTSVEPYNTQ